MTLAVGSFTVGRRYDPESRRYRCDSCRREVATGQTSCVCGARFVTVRVEAAR